MTTKGQGGLLAGACAGTAALLAVGRGAPALVFIALVLMTFAAYCALVWSLTRARVLPARTIAAAFLGLLILAVAVPPRGSKDLYSYVMYGRIVAQHDASPYTHVPADFPSDPALQRVQPVFRHTGSVYGPVFTSISAAGMGACGSSPLCGRLFFQALEALAVLGLAWIVLRATGSWAAAACVGFNPILIVAVVNGGHNDGLVALGLLAAVLVARERPVVAGLLLGATALVKLNVLLPGAVLIAWLFVREDKRKALQASLATVSFVVIGYLAAGGSAALKPLHQAVGLVSQHSIWYVGERWIGAAFDVDDRAAARVSGWVTHLTVLALIVVAVVAMLVAAGRLRDHGPEPVVAAALTVYLLASPYVLPWYAAPLIPLLAMRWRSRTTWVVLAYSALLFLAYPVRNPLHGSVTSLILPDTARDVLPAVAVLLLIALTVAAWRPRRKALSRV